MMSPSFHGYRPPPVRLEQKSRVSKGKDPLKFKKDAAAAPLSSQKKPIAPGDSLSRSHHHRKGVWRRSTDFHAHNIRVVIDLNAAWPVLFLPGSLFNLILPSSYLVLVHFRPAKEYLLSIPD
uniref:Uncharacterized protein n=1 Tax=Bursaphelenchus xylophilus TaxID=6326 RepID=A0A1I7RP25_BURXY